MKEIKRRKGFREIGSAVILLVWAILVGAMTPDLYGQTGSTTVEADRSTLLHVVNDEEPRTGEEGRDRDDRDRIERGGEKKGRACKDFEDLLDRIEELLARSAELKEEADRAATKGARARERQKKAEADSAEAARIIAAADSAAEEVKRLEEKVDSIEKIVRRLADEPKVTGDGKSDSLKQAKKDLREAEKELGAAERKAKSAEKKAAPARKKLERAIEKAAEKRAEAESHEAEAEKATEEAKSIGSEVDDLFEKAKDAAAECRKEREAIGQLENPGNSVVRSTGSMHDHPVVRLDKGEDVPINDGFVFE